MALAGFNKSQIEVEHADSKLTVRSVLKDHTDQNSKNLIHQGISQDLLKEVLLYQTKYMSKRLNSEMECLNQIEKIIPDAKNLKVFRLNNLKNNAGSNASLQLHC